MNEVVLDAIGDRHTRAVGSGLAHDFAWGKIEWLVSDSLNQNAALTLGHVEIKQGAKNPLHLHPNCDEVLYLLEGELEHSVDGETVRLTPGSAIFIPANAKHDALNVGQQTAKMIVAYSSGDRQTIMLEEGEE
ncbi:MAG: cupin domain-containing protein [Devosia sp.]|uniref:cupin domain-containing protein n=1 Tax=Devosia sp. TaxID=1871048 RepID=UPI0024C62BAA|nr:cupin domain-containing protein [Devosia sp.]UYO00219.1 MAG: cupin domain-containing protein [Devosia sp.]